MPTVPLANLYFISSVSNTKCEYSGLLSKKSLGDNANARIEASQLFIQKFFKPEMQDAVAQLGTSKEGIMALELIQEKFKGMNPQQQVSQPSQLTQGDLEAAMRDPRYWDNKQRDMNYVREVEANFKKLYG